MTEHEVEQARAVSSAGTANVADDLTAAMPAELASVISQVIGVLAQGGTVTVGCVPSELTTTTAAKMLDISRPTLMKLVRDGQIPSHKVGSHTRLRSKDVIDYRARLREQERQAFDDLRAFEDEHGL
ncbi:MAG TPA: helix-turn-helix domain-containing protein [Aldersonia sp.]